MSATLADSALRVGARALCGEWEPSAEPLRFFLGGRELGVLWLNALTLATPFTRLSPDLGESAPVPATFPEGVEALVIPAQPIAAEPPRLSFLPGMIRYTSPATDRYSISLEGTFAEYMAKFSAKSRYNLNRKIRRFAEFSDGARFREFTTPTEIEEFYRLAEEVSFHSWGTKLGGSGIRGRISQEEIVKLARHATAKAYVLFHKDRPIAYVFCRNRDGHLLYEFVAYDENYAKWSPGSVLLYLLIERLYAESCYERLDLGEGTLGYKSFFATDSTRCARVIYFRRNLQNLATACAHLGLCSASVAAGRFLRAVGMKQKLKRLMMGRTRRPGQES